MSTVFMNLKDKQIGEIRNRKVIGYNERIMGAIDVKVGNLICSDKRVILYTPKMLGRWETENIPLDHISKVNFKQGLLHGNLSIVTSSGDSLEFTVSKKVGPIIQEIISNQTIILQALSTGSTIPNPDPRLELQLLYATGAVTEGDYLRKMSMM